jgi:hypothetical protein
MMTSFFTRFNIRFQKKHRYKTLLQLAFNIALCQIWHIKKQIQGIQHPVVHLYAVCWNEEKIIPFFLKHYNEFVDHYYIYDNYSDDATDTLLASQPNITVRKYDTGGTFNDIVHQQIKNSAWKQSRGKADWVIVIDMDEFLYHPQMEQFLSANLTRHSIFELEGFDMVSEHFPPIDKKITNTVKTGVPCSWLNKMILFDPHRIVEINYEPGAHEAYPEGIVSIGVDTELKLLHYKYLGKNYVLDRIKEYRRRLSQVNREQQLGMHYEDEDAQIIEKVNNYLNQSYRFID